MQSRGREVMHLNAKMAGLFLLVVLSSSFLLAVSCEWVPEKVLASAGQYRERGIPVSNHDQYDRLSEGQKVRRKGRERYNSDKTLVNMLQDEIKEHVKSDDSWQNRENRMSGSHGQAKFRERTNKERDGGFDGQLPNRRVKRSHDSQTTTTRPYDLTSTMASYKGTMTSRPTDDSSLNCFPYDSCENRCGESETGPVIGYVCNCDQLCEIYRDCCADYVYYCTKWRFFEEDEEVESHEDGFFLNIFIPFDGNPQDETTTKAPTTVPATTHMPLRQNYDFECVDIEEFPQGSVWARTQCDPKWKGKDIAALCHSTRSEGIISKLPVQGNDGLTYRNLYCAQCNKITELVTYWISVSACFQAPPNDVTTDPHALAEYLNKDCTTVFQLPEEATPPRNCVPSIDTCDRRYANDNNYVNWAQGCYEGYQSLVMGHKLKTDDNVFRNVNCALCNGIATEKVDCAYPKFQLHEVLPEDPMETVFHDDEVAIPIPRYSQIGKQNTLFPFAVITNYNGDEVESTVIVDTQNGNVIPIEQHCDNGTVFDPYLGECRTVFCAENFSLVKNKCVLDPLPTCHEYEGPKNHTLDDEITITISIAVSIVIGSDATPSPEMKDDLIDLIAGYLNVTEWNYTRPEEPIALNISFYTVAEVNVTSNGLSFLKFTVILDRLNATFFNLTRLTGELVQFNIDKAHITIDGVPFVVDWNDFNRFIDTLSGNLLPLKVFFGACKSGNATLYLTDEVTFTEAVECPVMYVEEIDKSYNCREMLLLNYDPEGIDINKQNFSVMTCEGMPTLDASCVRIRLNASEYTLLDNGSIVLTSGEIYGPKDYLILGGETVEVCTSLTSLISSVFIVKFEFSKAQWILINIGCALSMLGLLMTFITYSIFDELRTLPGLNLMTFTVILFVNNLLLLTGIKGTGNATLCTLVAILVHFFNLAGFFWMNVMTYDVYKTFGRKRTLKNSLKNKIAPVRQYLIYSAYAWGCPIVIVFISLVLNFCDCSDFKIGYGEHFSCTISYPGAYIAMLGIPLAYTLSTNIVMFTRTVCVMRKSREAVEVARKAVNQNSQSDFTLAVKMSTVMGFSWLFCATAVFLPGTFLWYLFIIFNSLQGAFISFAFVLNKRVFQLYEKRFCKKRVRARARARTLKHHVTVTVTSSSNGSSTGSSFVSSSSTATTTTTTCADNRLSSILDQIESDEALSVTHEVAAQEGDPKQYEDEDHDEVFVADVSVEITKDDNVTEFEREQTSNVDQSSYDADALSQISADTTSSCSYMDASQVTRC